MKIMEVISTCGPVVTVRVLIWYTFKIQTGPYLSKKLNE